MEWILAGSISFLAVLAFLALDCCYYPALFFTIKFMAGRVLDFDRVRNNVFFQLLIFTGIVLVITLKKRGKVKIGDRIFYKIIPSIFLFLAFFSGIGVIYRHDYFQIIIDCYKYLEIVVYFFLFRMAWSNNYDLYRGLKALTCVMLTLGVVEMFITSRGGVGLNLIMSLLPMILTLSIYGYIRGFRTIILLSFLIVATCQTRTYIVSFLASFVLLLFLLPKNKRDRIISFTALLCVLGMVIIGVFGGQFLNNTLARFAELSSGFAESGGYRIYDYIEALQRFEDHPVFGNGFGFLRWTYIEKMGWMYWGDFVHCLYLEILYKVGITGALFLVFVFGKFIRSLFLEIKKIKNTNEMVFSVCCGGLVSFAGWLLIYMFAPLSSMGSMFMSVLIASIALSNYYTEIIEESSDEGERD